MKKFKSLPALLAVLAAVRLAAAPLTVTVAVHTKPDADSPVITTLTPGTEEPTPAGTDSPPGWEAVNLSGPHAVFVHNADILKDLSIRPGATYYHVETVKGGKPVETAIATAEKGDVGELTELQGRYVGFKLNKTLVGYAEVAIKPAPVVVVAPPAPPAVATTPARPDAGLASMAPVVKPAPAVTPMTPPAPPAAKPDVPGDLPRLFQGVLASTRSPFHPRRPYDYQLSDANGVRYAYVDTSKLPAIESAEAYVGRLVVVYGEARAVPDTTEMVVAAESLRAP